VRNLTSFTGSDSRGRRRGTPGRETALVADEERAHPDLFLILFFDALSFWLAWLV
jgi:hypothetical protein